MQSAIVKRFLRRAAVIFKTAAWMEHCLIGAIAVVQLQALNQTALSQIGVTQTDEIQINYTQLGSPQPPESGPRVAQRAFIQFPVTAYNGTTCIPQMHIDGPSYTLCH